MAINLIDIDWTPDKIRIRRFGFTFIAGSCAGGTLLIWRGRAAGVWVAALGSLLGIFSCICPAAGFWIYRLWMGAAYLLTFVSSMAFLAVSYYVILTPLGLILRLAGRDELKIKKHEAGSYWSPIQNPEDQNQYERLY